MFIVCVAACPTGIAHTFMAAEAYRNSEYSCGLSGNYTFMVVNPTDGDENTEAPLWVYLHGGGSGFFDENGDYHAVRNQTEDTWNHEETFDDLLIKQHQVRHTFGIDFPARLAWKNCLPSIGNINGVSKVTV